MCWDKIKDMEVRKRGDVLRCCSPLRDNYGSSRDVNFLGDATVQMKIVKSE